MGKGGKAKGKGRKGTNDKTETIASDENCQVIEFCFKLLLFKDFEF